jgi:transcriptional regulator with XRE-family HTH domain
MLTRYREQADCPRPTAPFAVAGDRLKALRESRDLSQEGLAAVVCQQPGRRVSVFTISRAERSLNIYQQTAQWLAEALGEPDPSAFRAAA